MVIPKDMVKDKCVLAANTLRCERKKLELSVDDSNKLCQTLPDDSLKRSGLENLNAHTEQLIADLSVAISILEGEVTIQ